MSLVQSLQASEGLLQQVVLADKSRLASMGRVWCGRLAHSPAVLQVGNCFSELVVGVDGGLRTYGLTKDPSWQAIQQNWMQRFQDFTIKAQYRSEALRYGSAPVRPETLVSCSPVQFCMCC